MSTLIPVWAYLKDKKDVVKAIVGLRTHSGLIRKGAGYSMGSGRSEKIARYLVTDCR